MRPAVFILLLSLFLSLPTLAEQRQSRVVGVHDGDTFTLLEVGNRQIKVRMAEIDAPESGQLQNGVQNFPGSWGKER